MREGNEKLTFANPTPKAAMLRQTNASFGIKVSMRGSSKGSNTTYRKKAEWQNELSVKACQCE